MDGLILRIAIFLLFLLFLASCASSETLSKSAFHKKGQGTCVRYLGKGKEIIEPCDK